MRTHTHAHTHEHTCTSHRYCQFSDVCNNLLANPKYTKKPLSPYSLVLGVNFISVSLFDFSLCFSISFAIRIRFFLLLVGKLWPSSPARPPMTSASPGGGSLSEDDGFSPGGRWVPC